MGAPPPGRRPRASPCASCSRVRRRVWWPRGAWRARVDAGGLLRVGPESAGADPGPAAYGGGGPATLTDALLVLGRLPVTRLAGGAVTLDPAAAERALRPVARALATLRRGSVGRPTVRAAE